MVGTPHGLFASDNRFVDVVGDDGVPEMAIGRLPVVTESELQDVVAKIIAYEQADGSWATSVLMVADDPDPAAGDFPVDSDSLASLIPSGYGVTKIHMYAESDAGQARNSLLDGLNSGALLVNYIGHAGSQQWASEGLLTMLDVSSLDNGSRLPVVTAMTCWVGRFSTPGSDSLSEALLLRKGGGAVAVWAPTGLSYNWRARILAEGFFTAVFQDGQKVLGQAVQSALQRYASDGQWTYMLDIYNLLGDPALRMK